MGKTEKRDIEEYSNYIKKLSLEELQDIYRHIDKESFPERYTLIEELLNEKSASEKQGSLRYDLFEYIKKYKLIYLALIIPFLLYRCINNIIELF